MQAKPLFAPTFFYGALISIAIFSLRTFYFFPAHHLTLLIASGWLFWTFEEYMFHRFVLHHPHAPKIFEAWHEHTPHHQDPNDPKKMVYSLGESFVFFIGNFLFFWGVTWTLRWAVGLLVGMMLGYLFYEFTHWGSHFWDRNSALGKRLFANHWRHHFENPKRSFGFSTSLWDWVFGTR